MGCYRRWAAQGWRGEETPQTLKRFEHLLTRVGEEAGLAAKLPLEALHRMDSFYGFTPTKNSEIRFRWQVCL